VEKRFTTQKYGKRGRHRFLDESVFGRGQRDRARRAVRALALALALNRPEGESKIKSMNKRKKGWLLSRRLQ
jgi:hypothetical protein